MSVFQFKQFSVTQIVSAMKIGTDSVLLGCFCETEKATHILDIGTGTGLLALMLAQKSTALIDAVEIDESAAAEAKSNFSNSPWHDRLRIHRLNMVDYKAPHTYGIIICNPPYYRHKANMSIADMQRMKARHDTDLPFETLIACVVNWLDHDGKFWLILPVQEAAAFVKPAAQSGLYLHKRMRIFSKEGKPHNREILCLMKTKTECEESEFTVYTGQGLPTDAYRQLTADYYLWKDTSPDERLKW
ncbi:MAG: tRNA1(Val) (adenine(37)-N6)-methyltransferase [Bacteroidota bacterium]